MSIPTHNLYDFIHQATERRFWLMYFYPWGSRDLNNLTEHQIDEVFLNGPKGIPKEHMFDFNKFNIPSADCNNINLCRWTQPNLICHDQEPLNFKLLAQQSSLNLTNQERFLEKFDHWLYKKINPYSIYKKFILLHSELNSADLKKIEKTGMFVGAFWWSHSIIARDWYRFAEYDTQLLEKKITDKKLFLVYCRRIDDSSAYRKQFLNKISEQRLENMCLFRSREKKEPSPMLSAEYNAADFLDTSISIVLETTFDQRVHITEKSLRPIACGYPFIIANGPGCLKFLRRYGFKTFHPFIDESYDNIIDDDERLMAIIKEMKRLSELPREHLNTILAECKKISDHNKTVFFSKEFVECVKTELCHNVNQAFDGIKNQYFVDHWLEDWEVRKLRKKNKLIISKDIHRVMMMKLSRKLKKSNL